MTLAVIPILVGPLQVLLALLPAMLVALGGALLALFRPSTAKQSLKVLWRLKAPLLLLLRAGLRTGSSGARGGAQAEGRADRRRRAGLAVVSWQPATDGPSPVRPRRWQAA